MIETELRDALHARAEGVPVGVADPVARVLTAVGADRRRRTTRGVAIVAALALATGLGSVLVRTSAQHIPAPAVTSSLPAPSDPVWADVLTWPARGSLIGDAGLVAAAQSITDARLAERFTNTTGDGTAVERPGPSRVLFAAVVGERRIVVTASATGYTRTVAILDGYLRVDSTRLAIVSTTVVAPDAQVLSLLAPESGAAPSTPAPWLILTPPTVGSVRVSLRPTISPDGVVTRSYVDHAVTAGVWVGSLAPELAHLAHIQAAGYDGPASADAEATAHAFPGDLLPLALATDWPSSLDALQANYCAAARKDAALVLDVPVPDLTCEQPSAFEVTALLRLPTGERMALLATHLTAPNGVTLRYALMLQQRNGELSFGSLATANPVATDPTMRAPLIAPPEPDGAAGGRVLVFAPTATSIALAVSGRTTSTRLNAQGVGALVLEVDTDWALAMVSTTDASGRNHGPWPARKVSSPDTIRPLAEQPATDVQ
ncbi:MAG: hypothetical protein U0Q14_06555 [Dermatophilaceae bacterium]